MKDFMNKMRQNNGNGKRGHTNVKSICAGYLRLQHGYTRCGRTLGSRVEHGRKGGRQPSFVF